MSQCSNFYCPRIRERYDRSILTTDATGRAWCDKCTLRLGLVNYGARYHFPAVVFPPYAVAEGQTLWLVTAMLGEDACVEALAKAVGLVESEVAS